MNQDELTQIADSLERKLSIHTIVTSGIGFLAVVASALFIIGNAGMTAFAILESFGVMLMTWVISAAYLSRRKNRILDDAVTRLTLNAPNPDGQNDTGRAENADRLFDFIRSREMTYALSAHLIARKAQAKIANQATANPQNPDSPTRNETNKVQ